MYTHNKYPGYYNSDTPHELTPMLAGWWLTQKPYKNHILFQNYWKLYKLLTIGNPTYTILLDTYAYITGLSPPF